MTVDPPAVRIEPAFARIYAKDGTLLLVCPLRDVMRWWLQDAVRRLEVGETPAAD